ncbi:hypothetical protein CESP606_07575 [Cereibacter sphaeroides]|uniref:hypothetical protein n=1 Tax=Cereibacter sphaeroides TaxID=1063 RepID=UPI000ADEB46C|nr:hypothetical protein [Cereibacter sphaeroides]GEM92492.1 hypothetical protein RSP03_15590 [Cereibacter sphaeroides]
MRRQARRGPLRLQEPVAPVAVKRSAPLKETLEQELPLRTPARLAVGAAVLGQPQGAGRRDRPGFDRGQRGQRRGRPGAGLQPDEVEAGAPGPGLQGQIELRESGILEAEDAPDPVQLAEL